MAEDNQGISVSDSGKGAYFTTVYAERRMMAYPVTEIEMEQLAAINSIATGFFSIASGLFGYGLNSLTTAFNGAQPALREPITFLLLSGLCCGIGGWQWYKRRSILSTIKAQSGNKRQP